MSSGKTTCSHCGFDANEQKLSSEIELSAEIRIAWQKSKVTVLPCVTPNVSDEKYL